MTKISAVFLLISGLHASVAYPQTPAASAGPAGSSQAPAPANNAPQNKVPAVVGKEVKTGKKEDNSTFGQFLKLAQSPENGEANKKIIAESIAHFIAQPTDGKSFLAPGLSADDAQSKLQDGILEWMKKPANLTKACQITYITGFYGKSLQGAEHKLMEDLSQVTKDKYGNFLGKYSDKVMKAGQFSSLDADKLTASLSRFLVSAAANADAVINPNRGIKKDLPEKDKGEKKDDAVAPNPLKPLGLSVGTALLDGQSGPPRYTEDYLYKVPGTVGHHYKGHDLSFKITTFRDDAAYKEGQIPSLQQVISFVDINTHRYFHISLNNHEETKVPLTTEDCECTYKVRVAEDGRILMTDGTVDTHSLDQDQLEKYAKAKGLYDETGALNVARARDEIMKAHWIVNDKNELFAPTVGFLQDIRRQQAEGKLGGMRSIMSCGSKSGYCYMVGQGTDKGGGVQFLAMNDDGTAGDVLGVSYVSDMDGNLITKPDGKRDFNMGFIGGNYYHLVYENGELDKCQEDKKKALKAYEAAKKAKKTKTKEALKAKADSEKTCASSGKSWSLVARDYTPTKKEEKEKPGAGAGAATGGGAHPPDGDSNNDGSQKKSDEAGSGASGSSSGGGSGGGSHSADPSADDPNAGLTAYDKNIASNIKKNLVGRKFVADEAQLGKAHIVYAAKDEGNNSFFLFVYKNKIVQFPGVLLCQSKETCFQEKDGMLEVTTTKSIESGGKPVGKPVAWLEFPKKGNDGKFYSGDYATDQQVVYDIPIENLKRIKPKKAGTLALAVVSELVSVNPTNLASGTQDGVDLSVQHDNWEKQTVRGLFVSQYANKYSYFQPSEANKNAIELLVQYIAEQRKLDKAQWAKEKHEAQDEWLPTIHINLQADKDIVSYQPGSAGYSTNSCNLVWMDSYVDANGAVKSGCSRLNWSGDFVDDPSDSSHKKKMWKGNCGKDKYVDCPLSQ